MLSRPHTVYTTNYLRSSHVWRLALHSAYSIIALLTYQRVGMKSRFLFSRYQLHNDTCLPAVVVDLRNNKWRWGRRRNL